LRFDSIRARFDYVLSSTIRCSQKARNFWGVSFILIGCTVASAIFVNIVYHCWYIAITVTLTVSMENISVDDVDDFLRSTAAVAVTVITSVCVLNKLATYCGLLWVITTLLKKPTQEKQIIQ